MISEAVWRRFVRVRVKSRRIGEVADKARRRTIVADAERRAHRRHRDRRRRLVERGDGGGICNSVRRQRERLWPQRGVRDERGAFRAASWRDARQNFDWRRHVV